MNFTTGRGHFQGFRLSGPGVMASTLTDNYLPVCTRTKYMSYSTVALSRCVWSVLMVKIQKDGRITSGHHTHPRGQATVLPRRYVSPLAGLTLERRNRRRRAGKKPSNRDILQLGR